MARRMQKEKSLPLIQDPSWYKDAVIYELHVRAFCDSNGDGVGDFRGLCTKLDYLQDLGITALWLLPFYPSPLRDDGYDIADYLDVHPNYGTLQDFRLFLREAHRRGLRVITELVINHTSSEHVWFQRARMAPTRSSWRNFYVWSDTPERYREARIIFKDFEASNWTWDPMARAYYWHRFYSHQPDLNYDNPKVHEAVLRVCDFWLEMGVDGLRLDAVPYLYAREGTNCENLPETHAFLRKLRKHVDSKYQNRMLLAEANQWPEDAVEYFGSDDECHMAFHFPVMPRMFMALQLEDRFPIIDILEQTPAIPKNAQWALFLRNHDELTLEMVTDEDRDYMYRVYAHTPRARINWGIRRRLAPLLEDRRKLELLNGLLFSLPGTPVIYYADEIGMGDNIYLGDRDGVRTPMQWSADRNAGFSRANPQRLYLPVIIDPEYHYEAINVEAQQNNSHSLLWWMKRLIDLRKQYPAFGRGGIDFLYPENNKIVGFVRSHGDQRLLVVANLSRFVQYVELNLATYQGLTPIELFGRTAFPPVTAQPYTLSLGPHAFFWFSLEQMQDESAEVTGSTAALATVTLKGSWNEVLGPSTLKALEPLLPRYLKARRWFAGKSRGLRKAKIIETIRLPSTRLPALLALVQVDYEQDQPETYLLPIAAARAERAARVLHETPHHIIARGVPRGMERQVDQGDASDPNHVLLYEATGDESFSEALLAAIARRKTCKGVRGILQARHSQVFSRLLSPNKEDLRPRLNTAEQSNTSIVFGDRFILKVFRRIEMGVSPDLEISRFLTQRRKFGGVPLLAGSLEYTQEETEPATLGILQEFVHSQGDAWQYTLDSLGRYFETVLARSNDATNLPMPAEALAVRLTEDLPSLAAENIGPYIATAQLLGQRTAEMHMALASEKRLPAFAPEAFSSLYQRSLYQSVRSQGLKAFRLLQQRLRGVPERVRPLATTLLHLERDFQRKLQAVTKRKIDAWRIRCHGDYHLGQVLYTGDNFVIIDFEGEPARPISERRIKRSPLCDVAGMLRSFHYASVAAVDQGAGREQDVPALERWAIFWCDWVSTEFLKTYLACTQDCGFLPSQIDDTDLLLQLFLLDKAAYELQYELNSRPEWLRVPIKGLLRLLPSG